MATAAGKLTRKLVAMVMRLMGIPNLGFFCKKVVFSNCDMTSGGMTSAGKAVAIRDIATWPIAFPPALVDFPRTLPSASFTSIPSL